MHIKILQIINKTLRAMFHLFIFLGTHFNLNDSKNPSFLRLEPLMYCNDITAADSRSQIHWRNVSATSLNTKCSIKIFFPENEMALYQYNTLQKIPQITLLSRLKSQQKYKNQRLQHHFAGEESVSHFAGEEVFLCSTAKPIP